MALFPIDENEEATVCTASEASCGRGIQLNGLILTNNTGLTWPGARQIIYVPFVLHSPLAQISKMFCGGANGTSNCMLGIYNGDGVKLAETASTALSNSTVAQTISLTATISLGPGAYYFAMSVDGTTAVHGFTTTARQGAALGVAIESTIPGSLSLPAVFTLATSDGSVPAVGFTTLTFNP